MKFKYIIYLLLAVGLGGMIVYRINANANIGKPAKPSTEIKKTTVKGVVLTPRKFDDNISLSRNVGGKRTN
ncbi:hypothetical protein [Maribacter litopenaei]|uniref:hypothetical protein n=1 Tax=Maribacter litopenaei TaxID=2976127 RepID=UPI0030844534